jgi:hypothetical protein
MEKNPQEIINGISNESKDKARLMEIGTLILDLRNKQKDIKGEDYKKIEREIDALTKEKEGILNVKIETFEEFKPKNKKGLTPGQLAGAVDVDFEDVKNVESVADIKVENNQIITEQIEGDYESQKAEIEKRWKEELDNKEYIENPNNPGEFRILISRTTPTKVTVGNLKEDIIKEINKKYDAELKELDKKINKDKGGEQEEAPVVENSEEKKIENIEAEDEGKENDPEYSGWTEGDERELQEIIKRDEEAEAEIAELMKLINELPDDEEEEETEELEKKNENKIEGSYTTIGYADAILSGKIRNKEISTEPRDDTVFEILKDNNGKIRLGIWKGAEKRVLKNPSFADGAEKMKIGEKPTVLEIELGGLQKDDEGGYIILKKPVVKFADESFKTEEKNQKKENDLENLKVFYAQNPNEEDGSFYTKYITDYQVKDKSVFKFTQTSPDTAEFELINDPDIMQRAINLYYRILKPVLENKVGYNQNAKDIVFSKNKGTVRREGDKWVLVDKMVIKEMV